MNVLTFKPLVSINVVPPRSESIRRMSFKPFLLIGKPIIRSHQPHRPIWHVRKMHTGWSMCSCLALYSVVEGLMGRNVGMGGKVGVMNMVVVTTLMETAVEVGNSPWEETTESQTEQSSALDSLSCHQLTREEQLLDNLRSLKMSIVVLLFNVVGEASASLEVLLEKRGELCNWWYGIESSEILRLTVM